ncbi:hypothetical protein ACWCXH_37780 [Kitasatospora sp. NPDC001660]
MSATLAPRTPSTEEGHRTPAGDGPQLLKDPLGSVASVRSTEEIVPVRLGPREVYLLTSPDLLRRAVKPVRLGGRQLAPGDAILVSPYAPHRAPGSVPGAGPLRPLPVQLPDRTPHADPLRHGRPRLRRRTVRPDRLVPATSPRRANPTVTSPAPEGPLPCAP